MDYAGFYINLDRSIARRGEIEAELKRCGLSRKYRRFPAAEGNALHFPNPVLKDGEMGCFTSHYLLLKENLGQPLHLHIVEDDVLFAKSAGSVIENALASGFLSNYDLLYTDTYIAIKNHLYKDYKDLYDTNVARDKTGALTRLVFSVIEMKENMFASTSSFLVNQKSIRKLHDLYAGELSKGPELPLDLFIRKQASEGTLKVGCLFPFATSVKLEHTLSTTIDSRYDQLSVLAATIARQSFFIDCDWGECLEYAKKKLPLPHNDIHLQVLMHILGFSLTGRYENF